MRSSGTITVQRLSRGRPLLAVFLAPSFGAAFVAAVPRPAAAAACDAPVLTEVACENTKTGNPSTEWNITGSGSASIQGFATDISVNRGSTIGFKVKTTSANYRLDIYRMGFYGGAGARKITTLNVTTATTQPACRTEASTGLYDCGNWTQTSSWAVPSTAVSGIYFAKLVAGTAASTSSSWCATTPAPPTSCSRRPTRAARTAPTASTATAPRLPQQLVRVQQLLGRRRLHDRLRLQATSQHEIRGDRDDVDGDFSACTARPSEGSTQDHQLLADAGPGSGGAVGSGAGAGGRRDLPVLDLHQRRRRPTRRRTTRTRSSWG